MTASIEKHSRKGIKVILDAANMSKQVTIKNQNKLKVYLEKAKKNDIKPVKEKSNDKKVRSI
jgi:hypothetical protein